MLLATWTERELILRMMRYVYAKSRYFTVTAILQEMQEAMDSQFSMLSLQIEMTKAVIPSVIQIC